MQSATQSKTRDTRIEWIKLLAILSIVFLHAVTTRDLSDLTRLAHGAVPAFTLLSVFFSCRMGLTHDAPWRWIGRRSFKLYTLFLFWNIIYFAVRFFANRGGVESSLRGVHPDPLFLSGYANALWFLNFVLLANILAIAVSSLARKLPVIGRNILALVLFIAATGVALSPRFVLYEIDTAYLFSVARKAVPSLLLGLSLGLMVSKELGCIRRNIPVAVGCFSFLVLSGWLLIHNQRSIFLPETLVGLFFVLSLFFQWNPESLPSLNPNLSLWLFVAHPLYLHGLRKMLPLFGINWDDGGATVQVAGYLILTALLLVSFYLIRHINPTSTPLFEKQK